MQYTREPEYEPSCAPRLRSASSGERGTKALSTYDALVGFQVPVVAGGGEEDGNEKVFLIQLMALCRLAMGLNPSLLFPKLMPFQNSFSLHLSS